MRRLRASSPRCPFFEGLDAARARDCSPAVRGNVHFDAGRALFREGDAADTFYVVRHGSVALETFVPTRGPMMIETIEAGEVIGWSWLFAPYRWHFDARALTERPRDRASTGPACARSARPTRRSATS